jgi:hypothetical protein
VDLHERIGPLPAWGWGVVAAGGIGVLLMMRGGGGASSPTAPSSALGATTGPQGIATQSQSDAMAGAALANLQQTATNTQDLVTQANQIASQQFADLVASNDYHANQMAAAIGQGQLRNDMYWELDHGGDQGTLNSLGNQIANLPTQLGVSGGARLPYPNVWPTSQITPAGSLPYVPLTGYMGWYNGLQGGNAGIT